MQEKTSATEMLEKENIPYKLYTYDGPIASADIASYFGFPGERVFKTLVTSDGKGGYYVFCLPSSKRIDPKKAASLVGMKNLQMLKPEIFEELTGYIHGGCSPFGMKTKLPFYLDKSAETQDTIYVSGGKIGYLLEVKPEVLVNLLDAEYEEFTK